MFTKEAIQALLDEALRCRDAGDPDAAAYYERQADLRRAAIAKATQP